MLEGGGGIGINTGCTVTAAHAFGLTTHQNWFVVLVFDVCRVYPLSAVLLQFLSKDVFIEEELQLFVGKVDAELFEAVDFKLLKPEDVQNTYLHL